MKGYDWSFCLGINKLRRNTNLLLTPNHGRRINCSHARTNILPETKADSCINKPANHNTMRGSMSQYSSANMKKRPYFMYFYARILFEIFNCSFAVVNQKAGKVRRNDIKFAARNLSLRGNKAEKLV